MEFIVIPAVIAFMVVGAASWNLKTAVRAAVIAAILVPVLFFWRAFATYNQEMACLEEGKQLKLGLVLSCQ